jgi:hypothetical protein
MNIIMNILPENLRNAFLNESDLLEHERVPSNSFY